MKNLLFLFAVLIFNSPFFAQDTLNIPTKFPTDYGVYTFPLGSKVTIELKETENGKYQYRVLNMEPYETYYSLDKRENLFKKDPEKNTVEIYFMGAFRNKGEDDKDWKTLLNLRNNLDVSLNYKAKIKYYYKDHFENTSIVGAFPKASTNEIWQHKIDFITLSDFQKYQSTH